MLFEGSHVVLISTSATPSAIPGNFQLSYSGSRRSSMPPGLLGQELTLARSGCLSRARLSLEWHHAQCCRWVGRHSGASQRKTSRAGSLTWLLCTNFCRRKPSTLVGAHSHIEHELVVARVAVSLNWLLQQVICA